MSNIIKHDEWGITSFHYMLPVGKGKTYSRSTEFRQVVCLLNEHRQNKQQFGKIF